MNSPVVGTLGADASRRNSIPHKQWTDLGWIYQGWKYDESNFNLVCWFLQTFFYLESAYLVYWPCLLCCSQARFAIRQPWPWRRKRHFEAMFFFCFQQLRALRKPKDLMFWFPEAALGRQVIFLVREATSGAALTNVADLEAAPEVSNTKSLQDELEPTI